MSKTIARHDEQTQFTMPDPQRNRPLWSDSAWKARPRVTQRDRAIMLTLHAVYALLAMAALPFVPMSADTRALVDMGLIVYLAIPAIIMAAFHTPGRTWWVALAPVVTAAYLWLPSSAAGSLYMDTDPKILLPMMVFAPLAHMVAPMVLLGRSQVGVRDVLGYGVAVIAAPALIYVALVVPMAM